MLQYDIICDMMLILNCLCVCVCVCVLNISVSFQIQAKGVEIVTRLTLLQFCTIFIDSQLWTYEVQCLQMLFSEHMILHEQFVEKFLNNYDVPTTVDLKDSIWKVLLEEIINR